MRLRRVEIQGFKNLRAPVVLDELPDVVVLHGANNVGKSNVLEALELGFRLLGWAPAEGQEPTAFDAESLRANHLPRPDELRPFGAAELPRLQLHLADGAGALARAWREDVRLLSDGPLIRVAAAAEWIEPAPPEAAVAEGASPYGAPPRGRPDAPLLRRLPTHRHFPGQDARPGQIIPDGLALALYDARESADPHQRRQWDAFVAAASAFSDLTGPGAIDARYDRKQGIAELTLLRGHQHIAARLLGTGVQQVWCLLGQAVTCGAPMLAIEEPELNLKWDQQVRLLQALVALGQGDDPAGPGQLFFSSHSPAFELPSGVFYHLEPGPDGPIATRRPAAEAPAVTGLRTPEVPTGSAPLSYITTEGLLRVPRRVQEALGATRGGGVMFDVHGDGRVELLTLDAWADRHGVD